MQAVVFVLTRPVAHYIFYFGRLTALVFQPGGYARPDNAQLLPQCIYRHQRHTNEDLSWKLVTCIRTKVLPCAKADKLSPTQFLSSHVLPGER